MTARARARDPYYATFHYLAGCKATELADMNVSKCICIDGKICFVWPTKLIDQVSHVVRSHIYGFFETGSVCMI